jgi:hypothetical protein
VAAIFACLLMPTAAFAQSFALGKGTYPLEFYDIDFSRLANPANRITPLDQLHYVPIGADPDAYVSFGGEVRQQAWSWSNEAHGLKSPLFNTYDLSRVIVGAYLHSIGMSRFSPSSGASTQSASSRLSMPRMRAAAVSSRVSSS